MYQTRKRSHLSIGLSTLNPEISDLRQNQMRRLPQHYPNPYVRRERDPRVMRRQARLLVACLVLAAGFVVAVREQIAKVQFGYEIETLREKREELLDEQRRLLLALKERSSPANLERAARELGLQPARPAQIETGVMEPRGDVRAIVGVTTAGAVLRR